MLTERQMDAALNVFQQRMQEVEDFYYRRMGEHIRDIGQLVPSDVHRLQQLRRLNRNLGDVKARLAKAAGLNLKDLETVLQEAAKVDDRVARKILGVSDASVALANNTALRRALRAQYAETAGRLMNLSNTTVVSDPYRKAVDAAVTAVQSGAEDYESAIRRHLRKAGEMGLRVRDTGTQAVKYQSGLTRRVDTAVRMNVLDAMRRMNQRVMEEVGQVFGADGVEIDAHMLCAEDHMPYQGQQFSNEEFQQIQDSLDRPFGEWNCRHTWAPIILGVSPRAYSDEDLERFARYSTEEVEIDGVSHTRYEWSQVMRRMETAIREKKDTATLAAAAGDGALRRQCQGSINAMVKEYERLSDRTGLGPDFRRTYVAGFKDVSERSLTGGTGSGIMVSDSREIWHPITQESLRAVPQFTEFSTPEANEGVHKACVEILTDLINDLVGTEETITLPVSQLNRYLRDELVMDDLKHKGEQGNGDVKPILIREPFISLHNHPSDETFSINDVGVLGEQPYCVGIVVIGNSGRNAFTLIKGESYNFIGFAKYRIDVDKGRAIYKAKDSHIKEFEAYGIHYKARRN